jgi:steroid 5-alpha reductase family enzyme
LRLAAHIAGRNRKRGEDPRYAAWRKTWGKWFVPRSYLQVFLLQGIFLLVVSSPVLFVNTVSGGGLGVPDFAGAGVWLLGFLFETVSDAELSRFKKNPENRGKILTGGLWRFTRHPNYFGEAVMWWGIFVIALSVRGGWATVAGPLLITFLLTRVSGVPMLERKYAGNPEFEEYARRTSAFIPWFPKKEKGRPRAASL